LDISTKATNDKKAELLQLKANYTNIMEYKNKTAEYDEAKLMVQPAHSTLGAVKKELFANLQQTSILLNHVIKPDK